MVKESPEKQEERLAKLWDAYETQERELAAADVEINRLKDELGEKEKITATLKKVVEGRDRELRDSELRLTTLEEAEKKYQPKIDELTNLLKEEKARYAKLFAITEELEGELSESRRQVSLRDQWFRRNVAALEGIGKAIKDRTILLEEAPELDIERKVSFETLPEPDKKVKFETTTE